MSKRSALSFLPEYFPEGRFSPPVRRDYAGRTSPEPASRRGSGAACGAFLREGGQ